MIQKACSVFKIEPGGRSSGRGVSAVVLKLKSLTSS